MTLKTDRISGKICQLLSPLLLTDYDETLVQTTLVNSCSMTTSW